jgi:hypothetical protein
MFYYDGLRADADLHNPILDDGDHAKAEAVSRKVGKRAGLSDADLDALAGKAENVKRRVDWAVTRARSAVLLQKYSDDEPRDDSGKWTDGGGGGNGDGGGSKPSGDGGGSKPVAGYSPGIKTPKNGTSEHADKVKQTWVAKSPVKTIDDVKRMAGDAQSSLGNVGRSIAGKLGIELKDPGSKVKNEKGVQRVLAKAALPRYGSLAAVPDVARITFLINHPEESDKILDELGQHFEVAGEPWKLTDVGYGDRAANVRLPNGLMGEIQIMEPTMAQAKSPDGGGGHDQYVIAREAAPDGVKPDAAKYAAANAKMRDIYGKALAQLGPDWKALFGNGGKSPKSLR